MCFVWRRVPLMIKETSRTIRAPGYWPSPPELYSSSIRLQHWILRQQKKWFRFRGAPSCDWFLVKKNKRFPRCSVNSQQYHQYHVLTHEQASPGFPPLSACQITAWFLACYNSHVWSCQHGEIIYSIKLLEHSDKQEGLIFMCDVSQWQEDASGGISGHISVSHWSFSWATFADKTICNQVYNGIVFVILTDYCYNFSHKKWWFAHLFCWPSNFRWFTCIFC